MVTPKCSDGDVTMETEEPQTSTTSIFDSCKTKKKIEAPTQTLLLTQPWMFPRQTPTQAGRGGGHFKITALFKLGGEECQHRYLLDLSVLSDVGAPGAPQGADLSPLLFTLYTTDLQGGDFTATVHSGRGGG